MARGKAPTLQLYTKGKVCFRIGGKEHCKRMSTVFVDSGASASVIPVRAIEELQNAIGPFPLHVVKMHTAAGPVDMQMAEDVEICVDKCCSRGKALFSDGMPGDLTLGVDFLQKSPAVMNFVTGKMACGLKGKNLPLRIVK